MLFGTYLDSFLKLFSRLNEVMFFIRYQCFIIPAVVSCEFYQLKNLKKKKLNLTKLKSKASKFNPLSIGTKTNNWIQIKFKVEEGMKNKKYVVSWLIKLLVKV